MAEPGRIRVGVIGCGAVAQVMHLPYLRSLPERFEIAALSDLSPGLLDLAGHEYGVPPDRRYADYRDLLASDVAAVLVLTSSSHAPPVLAAIAAGKHVLAEKPLCLTLAEADEIEAAAAKTGVTVMVGYMKRYDPGFRYGQRLVAGLDDIRVVQVSTLHPSEDQYFAIHGVRRFGDVPAAAAAALEQAHERLLDEAVGGVSAALRFVYYDVLLGSMVHDINALRALVGPVQDVVATDIWPADSTAPSVTTVLRHRGGVRTTYTWTYLADVRDYFEEIAVLAPAARVRIQFPSPFLKHFPTPVVTDRMADGALVSSRIQVSYDEAFREELIAFHECAVGGQAPLTDIADAREDIAVLQQILAAAAPAGLGGEARDGRQPAS